MVQIGFGMLASSSSWFTSLLASLDTFTYFTRLTHNNEYLQPVCIRDRPFYPWVPAFRPPACQMDQMHPAASPEGLLESANTLYDCHTKKKCRSA